MDAYNGLTTCLGGYYYKYMDIQNITQEEVKDIINKIKNDIATPEEELALLKFLNKGVDEMRAFIKEVAIKAE